MTFHTTKSKIVEEDVAPSSIAALFAIPRLTRARLAAVRPSSRGQVLLTIAKLRGTPVSEINVSDPLIAELLGYSAWVVDVISVKYDAKRYGALCTEAVERLLLDLEYEAVLGPNVDSF